MSSIAFPAFERAQQEHMSSDRTAEELYQSVADAIRAPTTTSLEPEHRHSVSNADIVGNTASTSHSALQQDHAEVPDPPKPKITKRVNARLQLAAALIEADNDRILEKAQFWHIYHPPQSDDILRPPPPPEPALASQSAIFAPFREGASIAVKRHVRTWSAATGLSRLLDPDDDGRCPSIDFLGVALPNEQKARSRAGSSVTGLVGTEAPDSRSNSLFSNAATSVLGRTSKLGSRPASLAAGGAGDEADEDAEVLSGWGVDKFLSKDERERIAAGQRSHAQSLAGSHGGRSSFEQLAPSLSGRKSLDAGRASSEIVRASASADQALGTGAQDPKLELMAKIKLYRERQQNLPPSEWDGPGPTATKDEVVDHIIASHDDNSKRLSLREASRELHEVPVVSSVMDRPRPSSRGDSVTSFTFLAEPSKDDALASAGNQNESHSNGAVAGPVSLATQNQGIDIPQANRRASLDHSNKGMLNEDRDMVGVGSFSRSQSRRNSFLLGPVFNAGGQDPSAPAAIEQSASTSPMPHQGSVPVISSPLNHARAASRGWAQDPFAEHDLGLGPSPFAAALQAASPSLGPVPDARSNEAPNNVAQPAIDFNGLSTRQLQAMARNSTFPSHLGINRDLFAEEEISDTDALLHENEFGQVPKSKKRPSLDLTALTQDLAQTGGDNFEIQLGGGAEPDLSSANWGKPRKKWFRLSMMVDAKGKPQKPKKTKATDGAEGDGESDAEVLQEAAAISNHPVDEAGRDLSELYAAEPSANMGNLATSGEEDLDQLDDDYISPPRRGPLRPRGLAARTPKTILMPQPLQGTEFAPKLRLTDAMSEPIDAPPAAKRHSLHVPEGFVLHDSRGGLPPMRSLVVHSANGPQPMFAPKDKASKKKQEQAAMRLQAVEVGRTVKVPAAAPRGIGRRAAAPTTALFRNHLVQHDDEREGWGFETGTRVDDIFNPDRDADSSDDDKPLADIKKQGRSAKRAAKRLAKEKRKRKAARRIRRAKREQALKEGRSFEDVGVEELSPDEDLDLSSTTSEEGSTGSETESDLWASDDDKRWIDVSKPAGKLYGKSLLDLATERNVERKSKARFYGQVQLEDGETTMLQIDDGKDTASQRRLSPGAGSVNGDAASIAPSVARSFRDKPLGYNDTRERMEAVFGADQIWAREMAQRQEDEAREAEEARLRSEAEAAAQRQLDAIAKAKKERGFFSIGKKSRKKGETSLGVSNPSALGSTASFTGSHANGSSVGPSNDAAPERREGDEADVPVRSQTPVAPPVIALDLGDADQEPEGGERGQKIPGLLAGEESAAQEWLIASDVESEMRDQHKDSSDDDIPLSQVKKNVASRPVSFAAGLSLQPTKSGDADSSDEELPLAALKEKRARQSMMLGGGKLDLDFSSTVNGQAAPVLSPSSVRSGSFRDLTNLAQNGLRSPFSQGATSKAATDGQDDDSDEDLPLGARAPGGDAALVAMRTAIENKKRALKEAKQAERAQRRASKLAREISTDEADADADGEQGKTNGGASSGGDESENDDSEDDKPLGYVHPQAAIIAEQAALIRQLQEEKEQQQQQQRSPAGSGIMSPSQMDMRSSMIMNRMSGLPSMGEMGGMGMGMGMVDPRHSMMGFPTSGSVMMGMGMPQFDGLPASSPGLPMGMSMAPSMPMGMPMTAGGISPMGPGSQIGMPSDLQAGGMSPAMSMPLMAGTPQLGPPMTPNPMSMMLDPKASSIHNWRTQVPPDATAAVTPPGGSSAVNSAS